MRMPGRLGSIVFAIGIAGMGVQAFIHSDPVFGLEPIPLWVPGRSVFAYLTGLILIAAAGALITAGKRSRLAAISVGCFLGLWVLLLDIPTLAVDFSSGREWTRLFETVELAAAAWVLAGILGLEEASENERSRSKDWMIEIGRVCFAISFPVFGVLHFIYRDYTSSVIPSWIPGHMFWAYFTGVAHIAAGAAILFKVQARLAASLLGVMVGTWALVLHIPRVVASPVRNEWTSFLITVATCGAAWIVAGSLAEPRAKVADQESRRINEATLAALSAKRPGLDAYGARDDSGEQSQSRRQSG